MTRLIDADALINDIEELITEHEEMMRDSEEHPENCPEDYKTRVVNLIAGLIATKVEVENAPTIDAEPVVRCKDCKHYSEWQNGTGSCQRSENGCFWFGVDFNDYCSFGERREP